MINDAELVAAQKAAAIFQTLGPLSPRDSEIIAKLRTVARLATDSVTTSLSEADRNIIRSEAAISIGLVAGAWEKQEPLPAEMTDRARKAARAWVEILGYLRTDCRHPYEEPQTCWEQQQRESVAEIKVRQADGRTISGRFEVSNGIMTVTASDGRSRVAEMRGLAIVIRPRAG